MTDRYFFFSFKFINAKYDTYVMCPMKSFMGKVLEKIKVEELSENKRKLMKIYGPLKSEV